MSWNEHQRTLLLKTARQSIRQGIDTGQPLKPNLEDYPEVFRELRATFVTLTQQKQLRGCIGSLQARRALISDIAENAFAAAFSDPRFPPIQLDECATLEIHLSILSPASAIEFDSEEDLLAQLRPGIDGLILQYQNHRGTFLPSVWTQLPTSKEFLQHLKQKAGLNPDFWSQDMTIQRYTTETIE